MRKHALLCLLAISGALVVVAAEPAAAHPPSGAIFTTVADGSEVNFNHYAAKEDVYLDGGPGPGAPQGAAGLDDGIYVFQVTDPSGKVLLSTDVAGCRRFQVTGGVITSVAPSGACAHNTGIDVDHGAVTVQLMPYLDTPNNGGVYKAWVIEVNNFLAGCATLGVPNGLAVVDCGGVGGNRHGFVAGDSKTDNFKVKAKEILEIDTRFRGRSGEWIDGPGITWTDSLGASNKKWAYYDPAHVILHEAHVEAVEVGTHTITVDDQPGCTVGAVYKDGAKQKKSGPQSVTFNVTNGTGSKTDTLRVDVDCI